MANKVYITIKEEQKLDYNLNPISDKRISTYINCDEITSWIGCASTPEDVLKLVNPEKIVDTLNTSLSCEELSIFLANLKASKGFYSMHDKKFQVNRSNI